MRKTLAILALAICSTFVAAGGASAETGTNPCGSVEPCGAVDHFPYNVIYVQDDTTSGLWPVKQAVAQWDLGTNVSIRLGKCQANAGCVIVTEDDTLAGTAGITWNDNTIDSVYQGISHTAFRLEWGQGAPANERAQVTCHELGHAFGLQYHYYDTAYGSCLYWSVSDSAATIPNAQDKAALNAVYTAPPPVVPPPVVPPANHKHPKHHHWHWPRLTWPHSPWRRH